MIRLIVDSNSQIPPNLRTQYAIDVIPLTITVDGESFLEGEQIDLAGITQALERSAVVGSSTPSPGQFLEAYERAAADGCRGVLSVHAGGRASGTANAARVAAGLASLPADVVDTGTASFPVALCAWAAGEVLASGGTAAEAAAAARDTAASVDNVFIVGTLSLAARGGRLASDVKPGDVPVLALTDGTMQALGRVCDVDAAVDAMADRVQARAQGRRLRVGVGHLAAGHLAAALEAALRERVEIEQLVRYDVGPSVAVHTGLGTVGCVFLAR
ncbi:MAG: DegV family protein [Actinomycetota bacterium]|nr:DegV family protein [Actinomycetota bacterium]